MNTAEMRDLDMPLTALGLDVPGWIDQAITTADVAAIVQGGCASGAYMPAVEYGPASRDAYVDAHHARRPIKRAHIRNVLPSPRPFTGECWLLCEWPPIVDETKGMVGIIRRGHPCPEMGDFRWT